MGISIYCGKQPSMDMSYSTFDRWRIQLAYALNENFGDNYDHWMFCLNRTEQEQELTTKSLERACNKTPELTDELFDFFMMPDYEGKISSETSKQLLPLIEKLDDNYKIGYLGTCPYNKEHVINFFKHSIKYHANVYWN